LEQLSEVRKIQEAQFPSPKIDVAGGGNEGAQLETRSIPQKQFRETIPFEDI
jgi:hypothetical protein